MSTSPTIETLTRSVEAQRADAARRRQASLAIDGLITRAQAEGRVGLTPDQTAFADRMLGQRDEARRAMTAGPWGYLWAGDPVVDSLTELPAGLQQAAVHLPAGHASPGRSCVTRPAVRHLASHASPGQLGVTGCRLVRRLRPVAGGCAGCGCRQGWWRWWCRRG